MRSVADIVGRMRKAGWHAGPPASQEIVAHMEALLRVAFPADYREFLLLYGGGRPHGETPLATLWGASDLAKLNERFRIPFLFKGLVGIANEAFMVYALDYRDGRAGGVVSLGLSASEWDDITPETDTFAEWLEQRIPGS